MRIGIYGGTFNPIHRGHLTAARAAMDVLGLDRLLLIPASVPPHKALPQGSADAAERLEMAALACAQLGPKAQALDTELHRTGPSYTVDTLRQLRMEHPEVGGAIGTTAGNAAATPASVAAVDATLLAVAEAATAQITAAIIVTAILCPIFVSYLHKVEVRKRGR